MVKLSPSAFRCEIKNGRVVKTTIEGQQQDLNSKLRPAINLYTLSLVSKDDHVEVLGNIVYRLSKKSLAIEFKLQSINAL